MSRVELIAPCHFGLESVLKREIQDLGYEIVQVEDGRITFAGDEDAIARANVFIRTAERIMLKCGSFKAATFDELFEGQRRSPGRSISPEMRSSGYQRRHQTRVRCSALRIYSP